MQGDKYADVSVVIPCYQSSRTIQRALDSVFKQTLKPKEVILIDDASGDDTIDMLLAIEKQFNGWVKIVRLEINSGAGEARNAGWDIATGNYVAFLDADDTWHLDKLKIQYEYMENEPDVVLSGHHCEFIKKTNAVHSKSHKYKITSISKYATLIKNPFSTPTVMIKRDCNLRFHRGKRYAEDFFLWQQVAFSGAKVVRIEMSLAFVHKPKYGDGGLSSHLLAMEKAELNNFYQLLKMDNIGLFLYLISSVFSLIKYLKRIFMIRFSFYEK